MVSIKGGRRRSFPVCVWLSAYNCQELFSQKNIKTYQRQEDVFQERFGCWYQILVWLVLFSWNNTPLSSSLVTRAKYTINTILKWVNYIWKTLTLNSNNFWVFPLVNAFCIIALVHSLYFICSLNSCALFISNLFSQDILNEEKWIKAKNIKQSWFVLHIFRKKS